MSAPHRLYVGTIGEGLFRSVDGGQTFSRASDGMFVECHVRALAVSPRDPRTLYLGSEDGLYRTSDGADHWARVDSPLDGQQIWSLLLGSTDSPVMLAGTCPSRIYRSADGGRSWALAVAEMVQSCPRIMRTRVTVLTSDPDDPQVMWAGVEIDGIWRSSDAG